MKETPSVFNTGLGIVAKNSPDLHKLFPKLGFFAEERWKNQVNIISLGVSSEKKVERDYCYYASKVRQISFVSFGMEGILSKTNCISNARELCLQGGLEEVKWFYRKCPHCNQEINAIVKLGEKCPKGCGAIRQSV